MMPLKMITPDSADRLCCLVIGKYGIGKTSLLRTIPEDEKTLVLSAESGLLAVRDMVKAGKIEGFEIGSLAELKEAYQLLISDEKVKERYRWVFIDSLTEISDRCLQAMQAQYPNKSDSFKLWADFTDTLTLLVKGFRDLQDYNVIFTCLETVDKDENNRRFIAPSIQGKSLKEKLPSYFDLVLYMQTLPDESGEDQRVFFTQPFNDLPAKDRSGRLNQVEKPNIATIKAKIFD